MRKHRRVRVWLWTTPGVGRVHDGCSAHHRAQPPGWAGPTCCSVAARLYTNLRRRRPRCPSSVHRDTPPVKLSPTGPRCPPEACAHRALGRPWPPAILAPCAYLVSQTVSACLPALPAPREPTLPLSLAALLGVGDLGAFSLLQEPLFVFLVFSHGTSGEAQGRERT